MTSSSLTASQLIVINAEAPVLVVCRSFIAIEVNLDNKWDNCGVEQGVGGRVEVTVQSSSTESAPVGGLGWSWVLETQEL